jgi:hypothetical protein
MAQELSTAGVLLKYAAANSGTTRPTAGYVTIPNIKAIPDFNPEPESLEVTDLSDTEWRRYIAGLKDPGGALSFTANLTTGFKSAWETLVSAYDTALAANKSMWFEIMVPDFGSFYFAGIPSPLGMSAMDVNAVLEIEAYVTPNMIHGWDTSSTTSG